MVFYRLKRSIVGIILILCLFSLHGCKLKEETKLSPVYLLNYLGKDKSTIEDGLLHEGYHLENDYLLEVFSDKDIDWRIRLLFSLSEKDESTVLYGVQYIKEFDLSEIGNAVNCMRTEIDSSIISYGEKDTDEYALNQFLQLSDPEETILDKNNQQFSEEWEMTEVDDELLLKVIITRRDNVILIIKEYSIVPRELRTGPLT